MMTGFQQVLERAGYLAKEHTKARGTGERNFAVARVEHDRRQYPATKSMGCCLAATMYPLAH